MITVREGPRFNESWLEFCSFMTAAGAGLWLEVGADPVLVLADGDEKYCFVPWRGSGTLSL